MTIELPMPKMRAVSNSEIQTWKNCRRRWYLSYFLEMAPKETEMARVGARSLGNRVHKALELMYAQGLNPVDVARELYDVEIEKWPNAAEELKKEKDLAVAMLEGYVQWVEETGADEQLDLVAAETPLEVPLGDTGFVIRGKLDMRVQRRIDHARLFIDHKTTTSVTEPLKLLAIDEQMKFYTLLEFLDALVKTGDGPPEPTDGGVYNMLRKVKRTAKATPPFYDRAEVRYNKDVLRSMWRRTQRVLEEIFETRQALDAAPHQDDEAHQYHCYPRPSRDCTWQCDYRLLCPMMDDGSDWKGMLEDYFEHVDPYDRYGDGEKGGDVE